MINRKQKIIDTVTISREKIERKSIEEKQMGTLVVNEAEYYEAWLA